MQKIRITETNAEQYTTTRITEPAGVAPSETEQRVCRACGEAIHKLPSWHDCPAARGGEE